MSKKITVNLRFLPINNPSLWMIKDNILFQKLDEKTTISYNHFQNVFCNESTLEIYNKAIKTSIQDFLSGINCTIFAYGQTGTGKTYTIFGTKRSPGIVKLALQDILNSKSYNINQIKMSYIEIYNETVNDLMNTNNKVKLYTHSNNSMLNNMTKISINNLDDAFAIIEACGERRKQAPTNLNERSSRSHTIFQVYAEKDNQTTILSLIDLAGSEKGGNNAIRRREGAFINKSLLALGTVVSGLIKNEFINYRDSKLTRILQQSLNGRCNVISLCLLSLKKEFVSENLSTLNFANRLCQVVLKEKKQELIEDCNCKCCVKWRSEKSSSSVESVETIPIKEEEKEKEKDKIVEEKDDSELKFYIQEDKKNKNEIMFLNSELNLYKGWVGDLEALVSNLLSDEPVNRGKELFILQKNMFNLQLKLIHERKDTDKVLNK